MAADQDSERKFVEWLREQGGYVHPDVSLFQRLDNGDRGVVALKDISKNEQLLLVPAKAAIYFQKAEAQQEDCKKDDEGNSGDKATRVDCVGDSSQVRPDVHNYLVTLNKDLSPFEHAVLILLGELAIGEKSNYKQYCDLLPNHPSHCLMGWTKEDLKHLQGTSIECKAPPLNRVYNEKLLPILNGNPDIWPEPWNTFEKVLQVACWVQSRAFHMQADNWVTRKVVEGTTLYMLPAIDMLNHSCVPEKRCTTLISANEEMTVDMSDEHGQNQVTFKGYFTLKAERDIKQGEEILHSYGDLGDAELLQIYGFIGSGGGNGVVNPCNWVGISQALIEEACSLTSSSQSWPIGTSESRSHLLSRQGYVKDGSTFVISGENPLPDELVTIVQMLTMPEADIAQICAEHESLGDGPLMLGKDYFDDSDWTQVVCLSLLKIMDLRLAKYATLFKDDERRVKETSLDVREQLALHVRMSEKWIMVEMRKLVLMHMMECMEGASDDDEEEDGHRHRRVKHGHD